VVRIWDAPTRWVHGLIIVLIGLAWWTESHDQMDWHIRIGCALLGVVVFRLAWGVFGGATARFSSFVRGPRTVLAYAVKLAKGGADEAGVADRVSFHAGRAAAHWHTVLFNALLALIALHLCAIAFYGIVRRDNLIGPMLTGRKRLEATSSPSEPALRGSAIMFWASAAIAAAIAVWAAYGFKF
jgi:cytochrome b